MADRHFACTACGKCCTGRLALTIHDALAHADLFPLAVAFSPVAAGAKAFAATQRLGVTVALGRKKELAVRVTPVAFIPPAMACPALGGDGLCTIHATKPLRCRAMPFLAWRDETDQDHLLVPRPGWACDVSAAAPLVYEGKRIAQREDFEAELAAIQADGPVLRRYAEQMLPITPGLLDGLIKLAGKPAGGDMVLGFATLLKRLPEVDKQAVAAAQAPVLAAWAERTQGDDRARFQMFAAEMGRMISV
ncbi:MAG: YkgJ family cysteine cluster protein [Alphaproteobacteria bacterium]|nr:YkgJ family cysteine cluster protein [Alphaproteobacteria bacterium]